MTPPQIIHGDCRENLGELPERHFHCAVTSPPYFGLRNYGVEGQIGLEPTPAEFVAAMLDVGAGLWRVLRDDAVWWLNLGDSYCASPRGNKPGDYSTSSLQDVVQNRVKEAAGKRDTNRAADGVRRNRPIDGIKHKDLMGIPWTVAFALRDAGWYLRDAVIWWKPAPMPGSQRDRCTASYELIFQLTKRATYFFDLDAIKRPTTPISVARLSQDVDGQQGSYRANGGTKENGTMKAVGSINGSTPRNVWRIASDGFTGAHFATFPLELPLRCFKASTSAKGCCPACGAPWERVTERTKLRRERPNDLTKRTGADGTGNHCANTVAGVEARTLGWQPTCDCGREDVAPCRVIDPFHGAGTSMIAAYKLGLDYTGIELNEAYIEMSRKRLHDVRFANPKAVKLEPLPGQMELFADAPTPA